MYKFDQICKSLCFLSNMSLTSYPVKSSAESNHEVTFSPRISWDICEVSTVRISLAHWHLCSSARGWSDCAGTYYSRHVLPRPKLCTIPISKSWNIPGFLNFWTMAFDGLLDICWLCKSVIWLICWFMSTTSTTSDVDWWAPREACNAVKHFGSIELSPLCRCRKGRLLVKDNGKPSFLFIPSTDN